MKICFAEDINREDSGKHKFLKRLAASFLSKGIKIVENNGDILLHIGRNFSKFKCKKSVMRVDGLILNKDQEYEKKNRKIVKSINKSDGVIYQSIFCEKAYKNFLNINKKSAIIYNGASPSDFLPRNPKNYFLAFCRWRPHKRERQICESFVSAVNKGLDCDLIVAGEASKEIIHPRIKYIGWIDVLYLKTLLSGAIASIHLSWLDWCPNSMIESIVSGCPVIYSQSGGSGEVGRGSGVGIGDRQWDYKEAVSLYNPPPLNEEGIVSALFYLKHKKMESIVREEFHIDNVANQYLYFFETILNEH